MNADGPLEHVLSGSELLLAVPDPLVFNPAIPRKPFSDVLSLPRPSVGVFAFADAGGRVVVAAFQSAQSAARPPNG